MTYVIKYDELDGVPVGHYYLKEIVTFGDFECPQVEKILCHAKNREDLEKYCSAKNYDLIGSWCPYYIKQRKN